MWAPHHCLCSHLPPPPLYSTTRGGGCSTTCLGSAAASTTTPSLEAVASHMLHQYLACVAACGWAKGVFETRSGAKRFNLPRQPSPTTHNVPRLLRLHAQSCKLPADQRGVKHWANTWRLARETQRRGLGRKAQALLQICKRPCPSWRSCSSSNNRNRSQQEDSAAATTAAAVSFTAVAALQHQQQQLSQQQLPQKRLQQQQQ
jgi:hypothetical protein